MPRTLPDVHQPQVIAIPPTDYTTVIVISVLSILAAIGGIGVLLAGYFYLYIY